MFPASSAVSTLSELFMIKRWTSLAILLAFGITPVNAQKKENERVASAGRVMSEILRIPDNIPSDLLQKAECVIVLPSVLKFAIGIGGSYGHEWDAQIEAAMNANITVGIKYAAFSGAQTLPDKNIGWAYVGYRY